MLVSLTLALGLPPSVLPDISPTRGESGWERRCGLTLPLRGRVGAKLRGGVMWRALVRSRDIELVAEVTPTRRFAATSPLKGEVWPQHAATDLPPFGGDVTK